MTVSSTNEGSVHNLHKKRQRSGDPVNVPNRYTNDDDVKSSNTYGMRPLASIFSSVASNSTKTKPKEQKPVTIDCVTIDDSDNSTSEEEKSESNSSQPPPSQSNFPNPRLSRLRAAGGGGGGLVLLSGNKGNNSLVHHRPPRIPQYLAPANASGVFNELNAAKDWGSGTIAPTPTDDKEEELWIDKYAPRKMAELVVHRKKVEEVQSWILETVGASSRYSRWKKPSSHKLLALVGPSGSGKSAMIKALAFELGIELSQWMDTSGMALPAFREKTEYLGEGHKQRKEFHVEYSSQIAQFKEFISHARYPSLLGSGNINMGRRERNLELSTDHHSSQIILLEDLPFVQGEEATEELQDLMANFVHGSRHPIVLIVTSDGVAASPTDIVKRILGPEVVCAPPTVKIISINRVAVTALRKCLTAVAEKEGLVNAEDAIESALENSRGDVRNAILTFQVNTRGLEVVSPSTEQPTSQSEKTTKKGKSRVSRQKGAGSSNNIKRSRCSVPPFIGGGSRDPFLNHFNALGRLLYRKKEEDDLPEPPRAAVNNSSSGAKSSGILMTADNVPSHLQSSLCSDPGEIIQFSTLSSDRAATFVQYHCIDFFTNVDELALTLGSLSDADLYVAREFDVSFGGRCSSGVTSPGPGGFLLDGYVSGIIARCVGAYNRHPAPSKFRQFSAPKWQELRDRQCSGIAHMDAFFLRSWEAEERRKGTGWGTSRYDREDMALSLVPAARLITGVFQIDSALEALAQRSNEPAVFTGAAREIDSTEENCIQQDVEIEEFN